jgi:hypothetical protein
MARQSFRLRRAQGIGDAVGVGSYVRGNELFQQAASAGSTDLDSALRSDGIIVAFPIAEASTFEGVAIEHNAVLLEWTLEEAFKTVEEVGVGESGLLGVALVYSKTGFPETVLDGELIYSGTLPSYLHQKITSITTDQGVVSVLEPEAGRWAYYSLFGYFNNEGASGDFYYSRLASIEVLVPFDYGSKMDLWKRVPKYYREADIRIGHLEKFIDVFGFELDRTRTLIDSVMTSYDPELAEAEAIDQLAKMVGLELGVEDIGVSKTRALLRDVGFLRKSKGTLEATIGYLTAVSGGDVTVFTGASAPYYTFCVHAERVNLVGDPRFVSAEDISWSVESENSVTVSNSIFEGVQITAGGSATKVALISNVGVPTAADNTYYMSLEFGDPPTTVYGGFWSAGASWSDWSATTSGASVPVGVDGRIGYVMEDLVSAGTRYPVLLFNLSANESVTISRWMVEPNKTGPFFDGDSVFGGYLYQNFTKDYRWDGTPYDSFSTYTTNRKKVQDAIERLLPKILPVTMLKEDISGPKYRVFFNWVPGEELP